MPALRRLECITIALASASMAMLALIHDRAAMPDQQQWPPPRIEFRWVREAGSSQTFSSASNAPAIRTVSSQSPDPAIGLPHPTLPSQTAADIGRAEQRLRADLSRDLYDNFGLFLYVSKAQSGPLAQHMYVFDKRRRGGLNFLHDWPVSTGREQVETNSSNIDVSTDTPSGYYELDPKRFYLDHESAEWHEAMPFAMFLDWVESGRRTGLAVHAATGSDIAALGSRASAGCIRLAPDDARSLFMLIRDRYQGRVPRFAIDPRTGTMSTNGILLRDEKGRAEFAQGYQVLLVIENYGGEDLVAEMF
jgi:hypothetical protein